jgi:hypothetical protein
MQPQSPFHPGPPEPGSTPAHVPTPTNLQDPHSYTAPEFGHAAPPAPQPQAQNQDYRFIFDSKTPAVRKSVSGPSLPLPKILLFCGGLLLLMMIFVIFKRILGGSNSNTATLFTVLADQQELVHLSQEAMQQQGTTTQTQNSASTMEAAISYAQAQLLGYLKVSGVKVNPDVLTKKQSKATDTQLTNAATSGIYDQTYQGIIKTQLSEYALNLKQAYALTAGTKGKAILSADYKGAQLLLQQLNSAIS